MSIIEVIAVIATLWCVWLTKKQDILSWPIGIIGIIAYFIVFYRATMYSDMALQVLFFIQSIYGWYNWNKPIDDIPVVELTNFRFVFATISTIILGCFIGYFMDEYTNSTQPYLDSIAASLSLLANWYLTRKIIQSWYLWISVDALLTLTFILKSIHSPSDNNLYLSAGLYFILLILATSGLLAWRRDLNKRYGTKKV
jgi:nicotinamide mononucleotide transporter